MNCQTESIQQFSAISIHYCFYILINQQILQGLIPCGISCRNITVELIPTHIYCNTVRPRYIRMNRPTSNCAVPLVIELTDIITPKSCSSFIAELIKYLAYNKQQIPFPFERLKMFVLKRRERIKYTEVSNLQVYLYAGIIYFVTLIFGLS